jgi:signal transduction histidine kinase
VFNAIYANSILYCDRRRKASIDTKIVVGYDVATISIRDNGIGIEASCLPNIFNMFYRASERSNGAGLGLYIAKETVQKLGGKISLESTEGEGTTVTISLPTKEYNPPQ